jgi:hypothetical protein
MVMRSSLLMTKRRRWRHRFRLWFAGDECGEVSSDSSALTPATVREEEGVASLGRLENSKQKKKLDMYDVQSRL